MIRGSAIPSVLLTLALIASAFETVRSPGLHKLPWSTLGLHRLAVYAIGFIALALLRRVVRAPLWIYFPGLAMIYSAAVAGVGPLAACGLFAISAVALGSLVVGESCQSAGEIVFCFCLGEGLLGVAASVLGLTRLAYSAAFVILVLLPIVAQWRWLTARAPAVWSAIRCSAGEHAGRWAAELLLFAMGILFLLTLKPEVGTDSLAMHFALPAYVAIRHGWPFDVHQFLWAVMPQTADWCYTVAYPLGGEYAARLLNFLNLAAALGVLRALTERWSSRTAALAVCALFAAGPMAQVATGSLFIENTLAALLIAALGVFWLYAESGNPRLWAAAWLLLGCALSAKAGALAFLPGALALAAYGQWRHPGRLRLRLAWTAAGVAIGASIYVLAWVKTGNPFFPGANEIFHSKLIPAERIAGEFRQRLTWRTLADVTFHSSQFIEGTDGSAGFQYFVLLPAALAAILLRRRAAIIWLTIAGLSAALVTYLQIAYLRYLYPSMLLLMAPMALWFEDQRRADDHRVPSAGVYAHGSAGDHKNRWSALQRYLVYGGVALVFAANILFQSSSGWYHRDFVWNQLLHPEGAAEYVKNFAPARIIVETLNRIAPGEPALFCQYDHIAGLQGRAYSTNWHMSLMHEGLPDFRESMDVLAYLNRHGIRYIAAPRPEDLDTWPRVLPVFFDDFAERVFAPGKWVLYQVKPEFAGANGLDAARRWSANPAPATTGIYDDGDARVHREGGWFHDYCCNDAFDRSLSTSRTAGDSLRFAFQGAEATVLFPRGLNYGIAEVWLDGTPQTAIDEYAAAPRSGERLKVEAAAGGAVHVLEIRVSGRKNAASSDTNVAVDAFQVCR